MKPVSPALPAKGAFQVCGLISQSWKMVNDKLKQGKRKEMKTFKPFQ